jgi:hypothetical protein
MGAAQTQRCAPRRTSRPSARDDASECSSVPATERSPSLSSTRGRGVLGVGDVHSVDSRIAPDIKSGTSRRPVARHLSGLPLWLRGSSDLSGVYRSREQALDRCEVRMCPTHPVFWGSRRRMQARSWDLGPCGQNRTGRCGRHLKVRPNDRPVGEGHFGTQSSGSLTVEEAARWRRGSRGR